MLDLVISLSFLRKVKLHLLFNSAQNSFSKAHSAITIAPMLLSSKIELMWKTQSGTMKKCTHYHKICSYLTVPYAYCNVLSSMSLKAQYDNGSGFISLFFISFWRLWTDNAIVLQNSWMNTYVACCPSCEKINIYLPQVPHKATRKRVFETRFLYIKEKKKQ